MMAANQILYVVGCMLGGAKASPPVLFPALLPALFPPQVWSNERSHAGGCEE